MRSVSLLAMFFALPAFAGTHSYDIKGMDCSGCVKAIEAQVCKIPGLAVCNVEIGKVTLTGEQLDDEAVKKAVETAGYKVVGVEHADARAADDLKPETAAQKPAAKPAPKKKTTKSKGS